MPRFVILRHEMPSGHERDSHFDLMLEVGSALRTWSLPKLPSPHEVIPAKALPEHRLAYLEYEGPVSGDRGTVSRVEEGEYEVLAVSSNRLHVHLKGKLLQGELQMDQDDNAAAQWFARFRAD